MRSFSLGDRPPCACGTSRRSGRGRRARPAGVIATMTLSRIWRMSGESLGDQPVGEFHQHLGRAGLGAVQAGHQVVDRLGLVAIDRPRLRSSDSPRGSASCARLAVCVVEVLRASPRWRCTTTVTSRPSSVLPMVGDADARRGLLERAVVRQRRRPSSSASSACRRGSRARPSASGCPSRAAGDRPAGSGTRAASSTRGRASRSRGRRSHARRVRAAHAAMRRAAATGR